MQFPETLNLLRTRENKLGNAIVALIANSFRSLLFKLSHMQRMLQDANKIDDKCSWGPFIVEENLNRLRFVPPIFATSRSRSHSLSKVSKSE